MLDGRLPGGRKIAQSPFPRCRPRPSPPPPPPPPRPSPGRTPRSDVNRTQPPACRHPTPSRSTAAPGPPPPPSQRPQPGAASIPDWEARHRHSSDWLSPSLLVYDWFLGRAQAHTPRPAMLREGRWLRPGLGFIPIGSQDETPFYWSRVAG